MCTRTGGAAPFGAVSRCLEATDELALSCAMAPAAGAAVWDSPVEADREISATFLSTTNERFPMATRREYTAEFKREAVPLAEERGNRSAAARELGLHRLQQS